METSSSEELLQRWAIVQNDVWDYRSIAREKQSLETSASEELLQRWAIVPVDLSVIKFVKILRFRLQQKLSRKICSFLP